MLPFVFLLLVMINGSHGLGFACKFALIAISLTDCVVGIAACHDPELDPWFICTMGAIVLGSATTHTGELYLRRSYAEQIQSRAREATRWWLEERNEQLQAEKERLLYDVQRRGRPLDDDDDRSAIRRGLLAGPSQSYEPGGALSSDSPPTLPPGPPSSASSGSVLAAEVLVGMAMPMDAGAAQQSIRMQAQVDRFTDNEQLQVTDSRDTSEATSLPSSLPPSLPPGPPFSTSGGSSTLCLSGTDWEAVARRWHALNPGWGCSAVAQSSSTQGEEQLAPKALVQASQGCSSTSNGGGFSLGASPCVELHQQGFRQQTGCWSPAEAAPEEAQRIEEGPTAASPSPCSSISLPHLPGFGTDPSELHLIFAKLFTPKHPSKLPRSRWVSCK